LIYVTRTRLDNGAPAVARASSDDLELAVDDRHITEVGATALERVLNGLSPHGGQQDPGTDCSTLHPDVDEC
jgi:hypothetical protein